ncbi:hypothetical protein C8T65DRAFT_572363 [Cerioporus squamosus]|nr:hypothetical protein C8T65DRAFT_572363 [Cerioporus squamosus]
MGAFPRALFSESELAAARWLASKLGAGKLPTLRQVKLARKAVLDVVGLAPQTFESHQHNLYTVEDFERIIKHEFANPIVRRHLATYAQDPGNFLHDTRQARKWREEVDPNLAGPMARAADGKDYFVQELALAEVPAAGGTIPIMILRWYEKDGKLIARAHPVRLTPTRDAFVVDGRPDKIVDIPLDCFRMSVEELHSKEVQRVYELPPPSSICGIIRTSDIGIPLDCWPHDTRNPWRVRAAGKRVLAVPIWLYCDDTSGNSSKKWNKHNSILFVLGGLPQDQVQRLYNIHFLSTSNIASPLEMMEKVSSVLRDTRERGLEVWDCLTGEDALAVPWVHAFQGDNPMASEFASHVGMAGKCVCRICDVYRKVAGEPVLRGVAAEVRKVTDFLKARNPRTKAGTLADLRQQEDRAFGGAPSAVDGMATNTGTKDKYFGYFVDELQKKLNRFREKRSKKKTAAPGTLPWETRLADKLREIRGNMPANIFNPVLDIPDFDAHADSPIEILHVVLLGVGKYFWRDACARQTPEGKEILKARLSSMNVDGLGISPIRGHTLVYYAKSLVGRDFRIVLQVAPAVLHGMVPDAAYEAWLALGRLAPLIFQHTIEDLPTYTSHLQSAIDDFLNTTALWTTQWFNKPKFHLFVHLLDHILRFGPAALYSTEAFESYNFVIRLRSINSNKHAPSSDIAQSFSHLHAVRHLLSGGYITVDKDGNSITPRQAGQRVRDLLDDPELRTLMCMNDLSETTRPGQYYRCLGEYTPMKLADGARCSAAETCTAAAGMTTTLTPTVTRCTLVHLPNGDRASLGGHVVYTQPATAGNSRSEAVHVGRVEEILADADHGGFLGVLVSPCTIGSIVLPYRMPACSVHPDRPVFLTLKVRRHLSTLKYLVDEPAFMQNLLASVNTFHNCAKYKCKLKNTHHVMQERVLTKKTTQERVHRRHPDDRVLNTAQLRSSAVLLAFRHPDARYPDLTRAQVVEQAIKIRAELDLEAARKKLDTQQKQATRAAKRNGTNAAPADPVAGLQQDLVNDASGNLVSNCVSLTVLLDITRYTARIKILTARDVQIAHARSVHKTVDSSDTPRQTTTN